MNLSAFDYVMPTDAQKQTVEILRKAAADYAAFIMTHIPEGPDRTYILRKHREVAMWADVAVTRNPDGSPRT